MPRDECKHEVSPASACVECRRQNNPLRSLLPRTTAQRRANNGSAPFEARYPGVCDDCGERILVGDLISYAEDDEIVHDNCP